ncbi:hypothetical protein C0Q70_14322 [Pomacea canaliculata]|uniref:Uncharacterized protein n=1 Tax=Pomacea canaliculata TaxID=400727 RepID=A0A2T7NZP8_POMCA|nr:hypothetical protein C0Q70_14322 [Pomacea canaliculata]
MTLREGSGVVVGWSWCRNALQQQQQSDKQTQKQEVAIFKVDVSSLSHLFFALKILMPRPTTESGRHSLDLPSGPALQVCGLRAVLGGKQRAGEGREGMPCPPSCGSITSQHHNSTAKGKCVQQENDIVLHIVSVFKGDF